jgi:hypothetical protein
MTIGNVTISGIVYPIKLFYVKNQNIGISASGSVKVSPGYEEQYIILKINKESHSTVQALLALIRNTANFSANTLVMTPDPNVDLGNGSGVSIVARFWSDNLKYIKEHGDLADFEFIFRKEIT